MYNFLQFKKNNNNGYLIKWKSPKDCSKSYKITKKEMEIQKHASIQENPDKQ